MKNKNLILFFIFIWLVPTLVLAQVKNQLTSPDVGQMMRSSLYENFRGSGIFGIDPSKLKFDHSYSLFFSSFGGDQSITQGLYLNTISYQFSIPLSMKLQWGFSHQPFGGGMMNSNLGSQIFLSGAELKYQPTQNMVMKLQFYQVPSGYYRMSPYSYPYSYGSRFYRERWWDDDEW